MSWKRVTAILLKSLYTFKHDIFRIFDIFWWPVFQLFIWGLFSIYLQNSSGNKFNFLTVLLGAVVLWVFLDRASKDISLAFMDELWNKNFINLFSSPLSATEYLVGVIIVAVMKLLISIIFMAILVRLLYSFDIFSFGWYIIPAAIGLTMTGWSMSLIVQSCIMRWGHNVEVFIWAIATFIQPFSCVFYPVTALPVWAQRVAAFVPPMYLFENMRFVMLHKTIHMDQLFISFVLNLVYFILSLLFFYRTFDYAKQKGLLIKNY